MDLMYIITITGPLVLGAFGFMARKFITKVDNLEADLSKKPSEAEVRRLIEDKAAVVYSQIGDIRADISEIKDKLDRVLLDYVTKLFASTR